MNKPKITYQEARELFQKSKNSWVITLTKHKEIKEFILNARIVRILNYENCVLLKHDKFGIWFDFKDFTYLLPLLKLTTENIKLKISPAIECLKLSTILC